MCSSVEIMHAASSLLLPLEVGDNRYAKDFTVEEEGDEDSGTVKRLDCEQLSP